MEPETISVLLALPAEDISQTLLQDLAGSGLRTEPVRDLAHLSERMTAGGADAAAVDVALLERSWFDHLASWRLEGVVMPVIFVLGPDFEPETSPELLLGRYDFLIKPLRAGELMVRVRSAGANGDRDGIDTLRHGDLVLHLISKEVSLSGQAVELTALEYRMLRYFMMRERSVISQLELSAHLYPSGQQGDSNTIEAYVSRLRRKVGASRIRTIRGMGYRFG